MNVFVCCLLLVLSLASSDAQSGTSDSWTDKFGDEIRSLFDEGGVVHEIYSMDLTPDVASKTFYEALVTVGAAGGDAFKEPIAEAAQIVSDAVATCFACLSGEGLATIDSAKVAWGISTYTNLTETEDPTQKADEYGDLIIDTAGQMLTDDETSKVFVLIAAFFQFLINNNAVTPDNTVSYGQFFADQCPPCSGSR